MLQAALDAFSTLRLEAKFYAAVCKFQMPLQKRRRAVGAVLLDVGPVSDAQMCFVQEGRKRRKHAVYLLGPAFKVPHHRIADLRQGKSEIEELVELRAAAQRGPVLVVAILFSPADIETGRLLMAVVLQAYPDVAVGRRQAKRRYLPTGHLVAN